MHSSAPRALARSSLSSLEEVTQTRAPQSLAIPTAAEETPPLEAVLAAAAGQIRVDRHAVADLDPLDVGADLHHVAGDVGAGPEGERRLERWQAVADPEVQVVQRARADAHEDVARADDRVGDVFVAKGLRTAELSKEKSFQRRPV